MTDLGPLASLKIRLNLAAGRMALVLSLTTAAASFAGPALADGAASWAGVNAARRQIVFNDFGQLPKWQRIRSWLRSDADHRAPALEDWIAWARSLRHLSELQRLILIQDRVNQAFPYATDQAVWGTADYWETPDEVVAKGRTDCEGFAIFKLWLARVAGLEKSQMSIYVGTTRGSSELHASLLVRIQGRDLVLDSRRSFVTPANLLSDFHPVMLLDLDDMHLFDARLPASDTPDPAAK